ncbi:MAG: non-ribosomal peptide synthetase, partial [Nitrospiraceae bacterium]
MVRADARAGFDLEAGPLIRGCLIRLGEEEHALLITMHHIVSDGWSMEVLIRELSALYGAFVRGEEDPLPELSLQYADYALWQRQWIEGEMLRQQGEYWERTLGGAPALLELPTDHPRPAEQEYAGGWVRVELDEELSRGLKELSRRRGTTLYMTLLAGWGALLARLSGQQEVVIGTPVANRGRVEIEGLIGFFVNTLALRLDVSGSPSVGEMLERVKEQTLAAQQHQDIPFEQVVEMVRPARSLAHSPIFQVTFAWQNASEAALELPRLEIEKLESTQLVAKFDLSLSLQEVGDRIVGGMMYATALYEQATVARYAEYFGRLLKEVVANPESCIRELPLLSDAERNELLVEWNATKAEYPRERCVHELFEEQVEQTPDAVAVVYEDAALSYRELNRRANQLAHRLRELGVIPGERVAMLLERSIGLVVAQLAVLKSGAAYVPIDPTFPEVRQTEMVRDSGAVVAITSAGRRLSERLAVRQVEIGEQAAGEESETNPGIETSSEMTAYVMYTSGSTGIPKGVMVPHRAIGRLVLNCGYASFNKEDRVAFASNPAFDASTMEVWGALLNGGSIVVVDREKVLEAGEFEESLKRHGVSVLWMTAGLMNQYAEQLGETLGGLRYLIVGGDVLDARVMEGVLRGKAPGHLLNGYGPTETTTFALTHEIREVREKTKSIPLGRPIANTQVYILDGNWEPTPVGVKGELYIGGAGVAEGYLNRPDLTAERFVPDGFGEAPGERMYRTGDLGQWSKEGEIEFEGRNDSQVKIRGFRVELGEIEARLAEHEGVKEAVVVAQGEAAGEKRLVAYYTLAARRDAGNGEVGEEQVRAEVLRAELGRKLPAYMVPVAYVRLEKMPLTPNGKLDRKG